MKELRLYTGHLIQSLYSSGMRKKMKTDKWYSEFFYIINRQSFNYGQKALKSIFRYLKIAIRSGRNLKYV